MDFKNYLVNFNFVKEHLVLFLHFNVKYVHYFYNQVSQVHNLDFLQHNFYNNYLIYHFTSYSNKPRYQDNLNKVYVTQEVFNLYKDNYFFQYHEIINKVYQLIANVSHLHLFYVQIVILIDLPSNYNLVIHFEIFYQINETFLILVLVMDNYVQNFLLNEFFTTFYCYFVYYFFSNNFYYYFNNYDFF